MREIVKPPQQVADEHTLIAQKFAGYLVGHPYRHKQQTRLVSVDRERVWREPSAVADGCGFCAQLTDEEAVRRVAGYQWQLDIEACRLKAKYLTAWVMSNDKRVPDPGDHSAANLRLFVELFQDMPTEKRPNGWNTRPLPMVDLPLRLKRKLCIEWNHLYTGWMQTAGVSYDFEEHEFWREVEELEQATEAV